MTQFRYIPLAFALAAAGALTACATSPMTPMNKPVAGGMAAPETFDPKHYEPFQVGPHRCEISLTIGYTLAPPDGDDPAELIRHADAAMYLGKQMGKGVARRWSA